MGVPGGTIFPYAIAFDSAGHVYLTDTWDNRVLVLTP